MTGSARGLFLATGNKPRPVPVRHRDGTYAQADALEREPDDFYPTPPEPTRAFLHAEGARVSEFPLIWEPAAGDGAMVRELERYGLSLVASDMVDRGCGARIASFYDFASSLAPAIVTNPPFSECNREPGWVRHAMEGLGVEYMALLLPLNWLGAARRAALWAQYPPARVHLMRWRIDFTGQGAPPMLNAWFVWDRQHTGETVLRMLDREDGCQADLFGAAA